MSLNTIAIAYMRDICTPNSLVVLYKVYNALCTSSYKCTWSSANKNINTPLFTITGN